MRLGGRVCMPWSRRSPSVHPRAASALSHGPCKPKSPADLDRRWWRTTTKAMSATRPLPAMPATWRVASMATATMMAKYMKQLFKLMLRADRPPFPPVSVAATCLRSPFHHLLIHVSAFRGGCVAVATRQVWKGLEHQHTDRFHSMDMVYIYLIHFHTTFSELEFHLLNEKFLQTELHLQHSIHQHAG